MELKEITNKDEWEGFLLQCAEKTFLQSWNLGEFNKEMGSKIWRFGAYNNRRLIAITLVLKVSARRGIFLFIPHGPVVIEGISGKDKKEILQLILVQLSDIAKEEKASFIRVSPIFLDNEENRNVFLDLGFRRAPIHMHPEITWELDITLPEEQLLMNMRKTTRYLIRQAEKNPDIQIVISNKIEDLKLFWPVYLKTAKRHHFVVFSKKYLEAEFNSFIKGRPGGYPGYSEILIFLGKYKNLWPKSRGLFLMKRTYAILQKIINIFYKKENKGQVVSAAIFVIWQDMCFYHHSGSLTEFNKIPVSYLLQWQAIKEAKNKGCRTFNFWGIAPDIMTETDAQNSSHPWAGLSLFKMGFGGYKKNYVKTQDFVISWRYWINHIIERLRRAKRGL